MPGSSCYMRIQRGHVVQAATCVFNVGMWFKLLHACINVHSNGGAVGTLHTRHRTNLLAMTNVVDNSIFIIIKMHPMHTLKPQCIKF